MSAPDKVDLSGATGPWPGFTVSGVTGTSSASINGNYALIPDADGFLYRNTAGALILVEESGGSLTLGGESYFDYTGAWPWSGTWTDEGAASGSPVLVYYLPPPASVDLGGSNPPTRASATLVSTGTNNDILVTATNPGYLGNLITSELVDPLMNNSPLSVSVDGFKVTVHLAVNGSHQFTATANQVRAAVAAHPAAAALAVWTNAPGNDGTGVCSVVAEQDMGGGSGGTVAPPDRVDL